MNRAVNRVGLLLLASVVLSMTSCGGRKNYRAAAPAVGQGVRAELVKADGKRDRFRAELRFFNDLQQPIVVNLNQIAVVGPDGRDNYRRGGRYLTTINPRNAARVKISVKIPGLNFKKVPGIFVRFDGVWAGPHRIGMPPMALGQPVTGPGQANMAFASPAAPAPRPTARVSRRDARRASRAAPPPPAAKVEARTEARGLQQYTGPRRKIRQAGLKCAAMPLRASEVPEQVAFIMDEILLTELQQVGFEAIGPDDVSAMIGFETVKDAVGCDDASCMTEIGNALGVPYLAAGNVAQLDGATVLTLKLIDVEHTRVLSRVNRMADGGTQALPRMIAEAVQELVGRAKL